MVAQVGWEDNYNRGEIIGGDDLFHSRFAFWT